MSDMDIGKLIARMDNLEKTTDARHTENTEKIEGMDKKIDTVLELLNRLKGGWFVLSVLGAIGIGIVSITAKVFSIKLGGG